MSIYKELKIKELQNGAKWVYDVIRDRCQVVAVNDRLKSVVDGALVREFKRYGFILCFDNDIFHRTYYYNYKLEHVDVLKRESLIKLYLDFRNEWHKTNDNVYYNEYVEVERRLLAEFKVHPEIPAKMFIKSIDSNYKL